MPGNHGKKPSDRRDSLKQQQRKNNSTHKQKEPQASNINNSKSQHRSNTPPASATSSSPPPPPLSSSLAGPLPAVGQNGFNSADVMQFLNQRFSDTLAAYHDGGGEGRPEKYESQEKAWGNKGGLPSVWGQKNGIMANGGDLLSELVKNS